MHIHALSSVVGQSQGKLGLLGVIELKATFLLEMSNWRLSESSNFLDAFEREFGFCYRCFQNEGRNICSILFDLDLEEPVRVHENYLRVIARKMAAVIQKADQADQVERELLSTLEE